MVFLLGHLREQDFEILASEESPIVNQLFIPADNEKDENGCPDDWNGKANCQNSELVL